MKIVVGINLSGNHNTRHNYENKNRTRHNALSHTSGNMVHLGFERDTGSGRLPYSGTDVYDISAIIRVRHTTIVLPPVLAYNPIYLVIGKIDRTYQQHLFAANGSYHLCSELIILHTLYRNVATDCSKCFAGDRLGPYRSFIDRTDLALFHGEI